MEQYVSKSALVAEINKLTRENELYLDENTSDAVRFQKTGAYSVLCDLRHFLDTLEVKEVDLDKELNKYFITNNLIVADIQFEPVTQMEKCAKYFFELGMQVSNKVKKEE